MSCESNAGLENNKCLKAPSIQLDASSQTALDSTVSPHNPAEEYKRENAFGCNSILSTRHHPFTQNNKSAFFSYFYTNSTTILNKFVMSYEEQLHKAITKGNLDLCKLLILNECDINVQCNNKFPICLACEHNFYEIAALLIQVISKLN